MVKVSKEEFFSYVGPRDIVLESGADFTFFKTRNHVIIGKTDGYSIKSPSAEKSYHLTESAYQELKSSKVASN